MMKSIVVTTAFVFCNYFLFAQNQVGINTTNPQASLDVRGGHRFGGNSNYISFDTTTGRIQWTGVQLFVPTSQQIIRHSSSTEGLYAGGGRLEYRNITDPVFYTEWTTGNGYFRHNLGINNLTPQFPLSFNGNLGDKISLWTDGTPTHYGFGIQSGLLQMFSKTVSDDIAFGYGSSTSFTERMRIKGNGNVGIGISNPAFPLDVAGRIRLSGANPNDPGMWLNDGGVDRAFVGLQNNNHVGFYGSLGWGFTMNTATGALAVNSNEGSAGQVLQSNGSSAAPTWASSTNVLYNNTYIFNSSATPWTISPTVTTISIPGLTFDFFLPGNAKVMVQFDVMVTTTCSNCYGDADIYVVLDGHAERIYSWRILEQSSLSLTGSHLLFVGPGSHNIRLEIRARNVTLQLGYAAATLPQYIDTMILQIIPQ